MRNCIFPQIKESQLILKCCICSNYDNIEIDHHEPDFVDQQNNFLKNEKNIPTKFDSDNCNIKKFTEQDKDFHIIKKILIYVFYALNVIILNQKVKEIFNFYKLFSTYIIIITKP